MPDFVCKPPAHAKPLEMCGIARMSIAAELSRIIEDHRYTIRFLDDDRALTEPLLAAVVPAMLELDAHDEELGDALWSRCSTRSFAQQALPLSSSLCSSTS